MQGIHVRMSMQNHTPLDAIAERSGVLSCINTRNILRDHPTEYFTLAISGNICIQYHGISIRDLYIAIKSYDGVINRRKTEREPYIHAKTHHSTWRGVDNDVNGSIIHHVG